jgi:hypothetical protein
MNICQESNHYKTINQTFRKTLAISGDSSMLKGG